MTDPWTTFWSTADTYIPNPGYSRRQFYYPQELERCDDDQCVGCFQGRGHPSWAVETDAEALNARRDALKAFLEEYKKGTSIYWASST